MPQSHTCNSTCRRLGHVIHFYSQLNSDLISQTLCVSSHDTLVGPFVLSCVESFTTCTHYSAMRSTQSHADASIASKSSSPDSRSSTSVGEGGRTSAAVSVDAPVF